jgi:predicted polyphosphate/ATP-dependent NAD kinase
MAAIGIIANPQSGKDIRRLVSYATTIDNNEKVNICKRIVLAAHGMGIDKAVFMPDTFTMGYSVQYQLEDDKMPCCEIEVLDFDFEATMADTVQAAAMMEELDIGCVVVLGGDGTSRAAAKSLKKTPMLSISTGTNNVYPAMMEGTVAGMAAAATAMMRDPYSVCIHDKRIQVFVNGQYRDMALIDAVISDDEFAGAKAIWDPVKMKHIIVSRCHPASIGFSAVPGAYRIVEDSDPFGFAIALGQGGIPVRAPIAAGILTPMSILRSQELPLGVPYSVVADRPCMIALDGEREVKLFPGDRADFVISADGPWRVLPRKAIAFAQQLGMFRGETPLT